MNRIILSPCRCLKRSTLTWEPRQFRNFSHIRHSRTLSHYGIESADQQSCSSHRPVNARVLYTPPYFRGIATTSTYYDKAPLKPSSKVEATVETIKKGIEENEKVPKKQEVKKGLGTRIMDELRHYYHGFRLLFIEIRISTGLCFQILRGHTLTRREHKLLITTIGDLFRMVPFIIFIVVPFLEFTLPLVIKFFPNMLPSTFESKDQRDAKLKQHLKVKLEMAKFFQETLDQMAPQAGNRHSELAKEFQSFFNKIRTSGDVATSEEIMKFSKLFEDEITLDSLQRPHLIALCKVLGVTSIGTSAMLRFNLRMKLRSLSADDKMIAKEGVDSLNFNELQQACQARGMRAYGVSEERLRKELRNWLDLSLNEKVPPSLLLLSRALMVPEHVPTTYKLKATISALPEHVVTQTKAAIGEKEGKVDFKAKLEAIRLEELRIKEEKLEMLEAEKEKQILETRKKEKEDELKDRAPVVDVEHEQVLVDPAPVIAVDSTKPKSEEGLSGKDIEVIEDALAKLSEQKKSLLLEKESIQELRSELSDYNEDVKEMQDIVKTKQADIKLTKGARRLYRAVNNMIDKLDAALVELEDKEKALQKTLEQTITEPQMAKEQLIQIDELMHSIKSLQKVPDEAKLKMIQDVLGRLDDDFDGQLKIDDVLKMLEIVGNENVNLSEKQMAELIDLLDKEEILEVESKIQKALDKAASAELQVKPTTEEAKGKGLFDLIREAQKRREMKKAVEKFSEKETMPKGEEMVTKPEEASKRPERQ